MNINRNHKQEEKCEEKNPYHKKGRLSGYINLFADAPSFPDIMKFLFS